LHLVLSKKDAHDRAVDMLKLVRLPVPDAASKTIRINSRAGCAAGDDRHGAVVRPSGPHRGRADDGSGRDSQAQIIDLMNEMQQRLGSAIVLITTIWAWSPKPARTCS